MGSIFQENSPPVFTNWHIYLHLFDFYGKLVGKYTIHGSYGLKNPTQVSCNIPFMQPNFYGLYSRYIDRTRLMDP